MEIIQTTLDDVSTLVPDVLRSQKEAAVYCIADEYCAVVGSRGGADQEAIRQLGVKLVQIQHEGGTIVLSPGDVDVGIFTHGYKGNEYRDKITDKLMSLIETRGALAELVDNDILVGGKKVAGFGSRMFGDVLYTALHFSVHVNLDLIKIICTKPMVKEPKGLETFGITTADVLSIVLGVLNEFI